MAAKRKLNPMERALAQADNIIAANRELERVSAQFHDRRADNVGRRPNTIGDVQAGLAKLGLGKSAEAANVRARERKKK
jgi:hypothetical protein